MSPGLITGTLYAAAAGLAWGLVFVVPLLLPDYPALMLSAARYLAFGLIALPLAWWDRRALAELDASDWLEALKLAAVGNLLYYAFLAAALQRSGGPLPTMIIGTLPVVIAVSSQWLARQPLHRASGQGEARTSGPGPAAQSEATLPWRRLLPSLALLGAGIALVHHAEVERLQSDPAAELGRYASGAALAMGAVACWTWYPIRNARWLRAKPSRSPRAWATAQGLATLPLAALAFGLFWLGSVFVSTSADATAPADRSAFAMPLGPTPLLFVGLMLTLGLLASWAGTLWWNEASRRLPTTLAGQLIVFETLAALSYAWALRAEVPDAGTLAGAALLVAGVIWGVRSAHNGLGKAEDDPSGHR